MPAPSPSTGSESAVFEVALDRLTVIENWERIPEGAVHDSTAETSRNAVTTTASGISAQSAAPAEPNRAATERRPNPATRPAVSSVGQTRVIASGDVLTPANRSPCTQPTSSGSAKAAAISQAAKVTSKAAACKSKTSTKAAERNISNTGDVVDGKENEEQLPPLDALDDFEARRRRAVFTAMLLLLEHGASDADYLSHLVAPMSGEELQQVAEERALAGKRSHGSERLWLGVRMDARWHGTRHGVR